MWREQCTVRSDRTVDDSGIPSLLKGPIASSGGSRKAWTASEIPGGPSRVCGTRSTMGDLISNAPIRTSLAGIGKAFSRGSR